VSERRTRKCLGDIRFCDARLSRLQRYCRIGVRCNGCGEISALPNALERVRRVAPHCLHAARHGRQIRVHEGTVNPVLQHAAL